MLIETINKVLYLSNGLIIFYSLVIKLHFKLAEIRVKCRLKKNI